MTPIQDRLHALVRLADACEKRAAKEGRRKDASEFGCMHDQLLIVIGMLVAEDGMRAGRLPMVEGSEPR